MRKSNAFLLCLMMCVCLYSCENGAASESTQPSTEQVSNAATDAEESAAASIEQSSEQSSSWKKAYYELLETKKDSCRAFGLAYVDGDDIPELYLCGVCEAEGDLVCSYKNGEVVEQRLQRTCGGSYIERSGNIMNQNGHMGASNTAVYSLGKDGFTKTFVASSTEHLEHIENEQYDASYEYSIDGENVSAEEYNSAVNASFDTSRAVKFSDNAVSYEVIKQQIADLK